jgi:hypothetical protein
MTIEPNFAFLATYPSDIGVDLEAITKLLIETGFKLGRYKALMD